MIDILEVIKATFENGRGLKEFLLICNKGLSAAVEELLKGDYGRNIGCRCEEEC